MTEYGRRLKQARKHAGLTQKQLAILADMSQSNLSELETVAHESGKTVQLAAACGVSAHWLATGEGSMLERAPSMKLRQSRPTPDQGVGVAHPVSHPQPIVLPKPIGWERLVDKELPERFSLIVRDDAMAPDLRVGHQALFSTEREPEPGQVVLLVDRDGHAYIRDYQLRRPGHWQAVARNAAYQPLDSIADGLRVLAVQIGALWG